MGQVFSTGPLVFNSDNGIGVMDLPPQKQNKRIKQEFTMNNIIGANEVPLTFNKVPL
jgi:hypothetical protein